VRPLSSSREENCARVNLTSSRLSDLCVEVAGLVELPAWVFLLGVESITNMWDLYSQPAIL